MKKYTFSQLVGVAVIFSTAIAALTFWYTYSSEPRIIYEQVEIAWPAAPQMGVAPTTRFLHIQFQNIGKRPAHEFIFSIHSEDPIQFHDVGPKLSGQDELKPSLTHDGTEFSLSATRFAPHVKAYARIWLSGSSLVQELRFVADEFGRAERVDSIDQALVPWYSKRQNILSLTISLIYISVTIGLFLWWNSRAKRLKKSISLLQRPKKGLPSQLRARYQPAITKDLTPAVETTEVRDLLVAGESQKALNLAANLYAKDRSRGDEYVDVLLMSVDQNNWHRAAEVLQETKSTNAKQHLWLAYRYWTVGSSDLAVEVAESGKELADTVGDQTLINKYKNSLAYYYADVGDQTNAVQALRYASEAQKAREGEAGPLDTLGYVQIVFGSTEEEILEGVMRCEDARRTGKVPFYLHSKHIRKAHERLRIMEKATKE